LLVTKNACINSKTVLLSKNREEHQIFWSATTVNYQVIQFIGFQGDTNTEKGNKISNYIWSTTLFEDFIFLLTLLAINYTCICNIICTDLVKQFSMRNIKYILNILLFENKFKFCTRSLQNYNTWKINKNKHSKCKKKYFLNKLYKWR
jgi:hypothetical protein